ncbi:uroporphyrinogen-III synthase [Candidatus Halobonum tyrrellensis]|uniref:Uroporphyrinogen-III synthase n=1 Tax=Candidatus Halobonum tyrrellensis G22 TaxID=1324957 RepID=V4HFX1_9EURY|nr:uroporphyrinogen-III synthase [Candidatus Halobonum tyrrellensis]ESP89605.1 uroporphyrinogen-III synthase [Candidatus Halobonum tyrrellensis G22]
MTDSRPRVAVFRPDDERLATAVDLLEELGVDPVADPMLAVEPTDATPAEAAWVVFTSKTGVELAAEAGWTPGDARVATIGPSTADAVRAAGWTVDLVPEEYTSTGLVDALSPDVAGVGVEVARSDHGSPVLLDGLREAGATVHETVLYRLTRPAGAGESAELAAAGELAGACFTSSLTVEHFLDAAADRNVRDDAVAGLDAAVVGCIGDPTSETAAARGVAVDVVPDEATFPALAEAVVVALE